MGYALSDAGDSRRATSVPSRRHSEKLRNRDDDFLRQSPASSPAADTSDGGMLDAFDSEFAADPNAGWLNQDIKFGSGPASPTIAQEEPSSNGSTMPRPTSTVATPCLRS